ncbi:MAG TPA: glycosyltransferase family 2 protein [Niastella sp.]
MARPLISVITPAYNVEKYIAATINAVIGQTYENWELIIVDDHSRDNTFNIATDFARKDNRIKVTKTAQNSGAAVARNLGIELAEGEYIAFLDSDDIWMPEKLEVQLQHMQQSDAPFSFMAYNVITEDDRPLKTIHVPLKVSYRKLLRGCDIGCLTVMYNAAKLGKQFFLDHRTATTVEIPRDVLKKWGKEDYVLWLQIARKSGASGMIGIDLPLAAYRKHGSGISANKAKAAKLQWLVYRKVERLNLIDSAINFLCYTVNGLTKHYL